MATMSAPRSHRGDQVGRGIDRRVADNRWSVTPNQTTGEPVPSTVALAQADPG